MLASPMQILIVAALVLMLFGAGRLSGLGRGLGEGIRNFKRGVKDIDSELNDNNNTKN
ncbi:MAG: twin-arginine translocase TatA/TatE family subunit [Polyangiaceae bacterium]|nr:twin-arginine translocase TatA/TatE family subunit [Polyangiaceae bacterium]